LARENLIKSITGLFTNTGGIKLPLES